MLLVNQVVQVSADSVTLESVARHILIVISQSIQKMMKFRTNFICAARAFQGGAMCLFAGLRHPILPRHPCPQLHLRVVLPQHRRSRSIQVLWSLHDLSLLKINSALR